jgi:hypothetical protein
VLIRSAAAALRRLKEPMSTIFLLTFGTFALAGDGESTITQTEVPPTETPAAGSDAAPTTPAAPVAEEVLVFELDVASVGAHCCRKSDCEQPCDEDEQRAVLGGDVDHGGYGGPTWGLAIVDGQGVTTDGGRGGWIIDHRWVIGGYGWSSRPMSTPENGKLLGRSSGGGMFVERILFPNSEVHPTLEVAVGSGSLQTCAGKQHTLHAAAAMRMEVNLARWARVAAGPRIDTQIVPGYPSKILLDGTAIGGDLMLKFGWF